MATYRITLVQALPNRAPSRLQVRYDFAAGPQTWWLDNANPDRDVAVFTADCATDLINQPGVSTRTVIGHYPDAPNTEERQISSVQLP
jgi:hypothetical protein